MKKKLPFLVFKIIISVCLITILFSELAFAQAYNIKNDSFNKRFDVIVKEENKTWTTISVENISVKNNEVEIGFLVDGKAGAFCLVDDISLILSK